MTRFLLSTAPLVRFAAYWVGAALAFRLFDDGLDALTAYLHLPGL